MREQDIKFTLRIYKNPAELQPQDAELLNAAKEALKNAYAPYSQFNVAAAVLLENGKILTGTNQENASYPVTICAEGTVLSAVSALYPGVAVKKMAITVKSERHITTKPAGPCGVCRQRISEYENRFNTNIEIIMMAEEGEVYWVKSVQDLLPLSFSKTDL